MPSEIPPQEQTRKWFRSHLLAREIELQDLYDLPQGELDLVMAETAEIRSDGENRNRSHGRWCSGLRAGTGPDHRQETGRHTVRLLIEIRPCFALAHSERGELRVLGHAHEAEH